MCETYESALGMSGTYIFHSLKKSKDSLPAVRFAWTNYYVTLFIKPIATFRRLHYCLNAKYKFSDWSFLYVILNNNIYSSNEWTNDVY